MAARIALIVVAALTLITSTAFAQTYTDVPRAEDSSFQGKIQVPPDIVSGHTQGFVRELEISFKWAGFFGQPVESYALRWQMGEVIRRSGKPPLRRSDLEKYPDLLEQFDDLKPTEIILNTQVLAYSAQLKPENWQENQPNNYLSASNPYFAQGTKTISRVPHLVIRRSGELGTDIIPSSPQKTQDFIRWNYLPSGADAEEAASNTLNLADRLRVGALAIDKIEVPFAALDRIQKEYLKREKEEAEEEEDDFWGDEEDEQEEDSEQGTSDDDFWGEEDDQQESASNDDDFWACPNQSSGQSNDCWKKPAPKVAVKKKASPVDAGKSQTFEIIKNDNKEWGVRSSTGRMVIPFSKTMILSYKEGVAKVAKPTESKEYTCAVGTGAFSGALQAWTSLDVWSEGLMDHDGNWIIAPKKKGYFGISDRRCRKFLPEVRRYARSNNIELIEDFDEYLKIGGKLKW